MKKKKNLWKCQQSFDLTFFDFHSSLILPFCLEWSMSEVFRHVKLDRDRSVWSESAHKNHFSPLLTLDANLKSSFGFLINHKNDCTCIFIFASFFQWKYRKIQRIAKLFFSVYTSNFNIWIFAPKSTTFILIVLSGFLIIFGILALKVVQNSNVNFGLFGPKWDFWTSVHYIVHFVSNTSSLASWLEEKGRSRQFVSTQPRDTF